MVTQQVVLTTTVVAAEDLPVHRLVGISAKPFKGSGTELGVADVAGKKGDAVPVNVIGIMAVETGNAISAGELLKSDDQGRVIPESALEKGALPASTVGVALDSATAEGQLIRMVRGI
ncbi:capsid cement protein [Candidatus Williamhamiltonella defendens]|uniref:capsid cement protein n=1 Tax=Candidatus Williamhamiltonella defendens TaxID=138072 RepID=UPI0002D7D2AC|nr:capsid cement protein [Candidatus Hamiltonella defensa]